MKKNYSLAGLKKKNHKFNKNKKKYLKVYEK
jgi:hypothetical protein